MLFRALRSPLHVEHYFLIAIIRRHQLFKVTQHFQLADWPLNVLPKKLDLPLIIAVPGDDSAIKLSRGVHGHQIFQPDLHIFICNLGYINSSFKLNFNCLIQAYRKL